MKKSLEETAMRSRNISWLVSVDELAKKLAGERKTSVSGLLAALVVRESAMNEKEEEA